ncbi:efflux RND transporter periplasmic adaptor subunit [Caulobacter mirabilis]|uniref:Efflux transporter periplasmic adaptor subunit n=1 Tax=Caulobacter mirabilis TaxID=69666 RepID=A0A2D2B1P8_9CAUL|nr:efflux RND transporter periplasmic adaptor subunit [Caulobacter mirabilis]ATQ44163.1 efflux transporter periplasmic adaptor subunit [Caulobacter mirabilis]
MRKLPAFTALGLITAVALAGCGKPEAQGAPPPPQVSVATPLQETVVDWSDFVGRFEAPQQVEVRARAGGFVQAVHFRDGQYVQKGQLLFTLDPRQAQAALASAQARAAQARGELERAEALVATQAISRELYDSRKAAALVADAEVRARQLDVEFTRVTAPISGTVSDRRVDPGNVIAGGTSAGDVLTTIVSTSPIYFTFDASEAQLLQAQRAGAKGGATVKVKLQDEPDYNWTGKVDFSDNALDGGSGAVRMRAVINNPGNFLKPGMFGHARLEGAAPYQAMLLPDTAIASDAARKVVYVANADGSVAVKPVQLGPLSGGLRVIRSGLTPTDKVIVNGIQRVQQPGVKVQAKTVAITRPKSGPVGQAPAPSIPPASVATPVGAN